LKRKGVDEQTIADATGLTQEEVQKLTGIINYVELLRRFGNYILRSLKALNVKLLILIQ
jgi:hypothetical protein